MKTSNRNPVLTEAKQAKKPNLVAIQGTFVRFQVLDSWRGIAATMVAVFHFMVLHHAFAAPLVRNAFLFVDFFFVLSGFVISHAYVVHLTSWRDIARFAIRRFGRIWPLHVATLAVLVALEVAKPVMASVIGQSLNTAAFEVQGSNPGYVLPLHLLFLQSFGLTDRLTWNYPSWSIAAEFWTYIVFALASVMTPRTRTAILAVLAWVAMYVLVTRSNSGMDATYDLGFFRSLIGFAIGHFVYLARQHWRGSGQCAGTLAEFIAVAAVITFVSSAGYGLLSFAAPIVFAPAILIFSFEAGALSRSLMLPVFQKLGAWSYSIYMVHVPAIIIMTNMITVAERALEQTLWHDVTVGGQAMRVFDPGNALIGDGALVLFLAIVFAIAAAAYRWIECPARDAFSKIAHRQFPVSSPVQA